MKTNAVLYLTALARVALATGVTGNKPITRYPCPTGCCFLLFLLTPSPAGSAKGFAKGVTGGGTATPVYPTTTAELISYLGDDEARVIIIDGTYDFTDTEGTTTGTACTPWGTASACQLAIDKDSWCENYQPDAATTTVTYDNAGVLGITVGSNKSLVGKNSATLKGKGIRIVEASNVIIQNIAITDINPRFVWGGDAVTLDKTDLVWIDHVTVSFPPPLRGLSPQC